jgi:hypothetical protein
MYDGLETLITLGTALYAVAIALVGGCVIGYSACHIQRENDNV